ncbi:phytoene/squalene synthase family protein [Pedobacter puniceum]|uniref:Phytoene/squalene synthase family protein n=1 Tax=Pedobacter puniceum TaxID=2666136 RepID=A0A7K0FS28_9SPHI|nr:phytoene/squalene synthase family protein [Pedobacter puniceum]MRX47887.1 phytoene/squalene synthase family protein [Pedobacter puniceum]
MDLYTQTCLDCSKIITNNYSTSFSLGIKAFDKKFREPIYAIYGFVRFADEIVDTFHDQDKESLIAQFRKDTVEAIKRKISLNPVLHAFQLVVNQYHIEFHLIDAFLKSMEMDLDKTRYTDDSYKEYIYGSAEVVGLMCLRVFCEGNHQLYDTLLPKARSLGSAFQKINFLRDIKSDFEERGRTYFPGVDFTKFTEADKQEIEKDIKVDFDDALEGIKLLPQGSKLGVYIAYIYYLKLFEKIRATSAQTIANKRIRIPDTQKIFLMAQALIKDKLNFV